MQRLRVFHPKYTEWLEVNFETQNLLNNEVNQKIKDIIFNKETDWTKPWKLQGAVTDLAGMNFKFFVFFGHIPSYGGCRVFLVFQYTSETRCPRILAYGYNDNYSFVTPLTDSASKDIKSCATLALSVVNTDEVVNSHLKNVIKQYQTTRNENLFVWFFD